VNPPAASPESPAPRESFWQRRIRRPIIGQLKQGITGRKIAATIAIGIVLAIFPILGSTTLLCALAGFLFKLNQPIIQTVNYFSYPLQLALLIPFYRAGETLFGHPHVPLSIPLFIARIRVDFLQFLRDFGLIAVDGIIVWCLLAPILAGLLYLALRPPLLALEKRIAA
jgi:uncharacterized protein (DUF2062 family)